MSTVKDTKSGFSADERAAMKQRAAELKAQKAAKSKADDLQGVLDAIAKLPEADRVLAERIHEIVTTVAPSLDPKTWYGFPAYSRNGKVAVYFKPASKFNDRYATLGFEQAAQLDDGQMWPVAFALLSITPAEEERIAELVKRATG